MLRAIALDFDGVLAETAEVKVRAFAKVFATESPAMVERILAYHRQHGGVSRFEKFRFIYRELLKRPLPEEAFERLCRRFADLVVDQVVAAPWIEGAQELLAAIRGRCRACIVSGTPEQELRDIIRRRHMEAGFDGIFGAPKTKPVILTEILTHWNLVPEEMVFVGDAITDWEAARHVGVPFIRRRPADDTTVWPGFTGPEVVSLRSVIPWLSRRRVGAGVVNR